MPDEKRKRLYDHAKHIQHPDDWAAYKKARNQVNNILGKAHQRIGSSFWWYFYQQPYKIWVLNQKNKKESPTSGATLHWTQLWQMKLNSDKCIVATKLHKILFALPDKLLAIYIDDKLLK